jgi:thiol-disulfide isomerase/thioredoxin
MKASTRRLLLAGAAGAALAAGFGGGWAWNRRGADARREQEALRELLALTLPDPDGKPQALSQWDGQVRVINFWATWCAPCREEMPHFVKLQTRYGTRGVTFLGVAIDRAERVARFAAEIGVNYPLLLADMSLLGLASRIGNRGEVLPFTLVLDRSAKIAARRTGIYTEEALAAILDGVVSSPRSPAA